MSFETSEKHDYLYFILIPCAIDIQSVLNPNICERYVLYTSVYISGFAFFQTHSSNL